MHTTTKCNCCYMLELTYNIGVTFVCTINALLVQCTHAKGFPDSEFILILNGKLQENCISELESFYDKYMLPELLFGYYKPGYIIYM